MLAEPTTCRKTTQKTITKEKGRFVPIWGYWCSPGGGEIPKRGRGVVAFIIITPPSSLNTTSDLLKALRLSFGIAWRDFDFGCLHPRCGDGLAWERAQCRRCGW